MTKVLITGSGSFVGNNFRKYSKFTDIKEISLVDNNPEKIDFSGFDVVLHLAAIVHQSEKIPESKYFLVNRDLCLSVAEEAKKAGVKQFVFLSTLKVFGDLINGSVLRNEDSECFPDDNYGRSKYAAEVGLKEIEDSNFSVSIIRTPLIYGEGFKANMMNLVKLVDTFRLLPFDKIGNKRNFTFAENLVGFIDSIIDLKARGTFIAMDEKAISTTDLIKYISIGLGKRTYMFKLPAICLKICGLFYPAAVDRLYGSAEFDNTKTKAILNYSPNFTTEEGIIKTVLFYLANKKNEKRS